MAKWGHVVVLVTLFAMVGCSTTGGTIGGLLAAPNSLKGKINNNTYTAQGKTFSVAVPQKEGSYEFTYMQVKEQYSEDGVYVSFGPFAFDQSIYRIETAKPVTPGSQSVKFNDLAAVFVEGFKAQLQEGYGTSPEEAESRQETINGRRAYYYKLTQTVPGSKSGKLSINEEGNLVPEDIYVIHDVYVIDFDEKGAALVGVQNSEIEGHTPGLEPRAFAESLTIF